jgi:hypothetical protein
VDVEVEGGADVGVAEEDADGLVVAAAFYAAGGEAVAEAVVEVPVSEDVLTTTSETDNNPTPIEESQTTKSWKEISIGDNVSHKSLGPGTVMSLDEKYIIIRFRDRESKFFYPGAYERGYLEC